MVAQSVLTIIQCSLDAAASAYLLMDPVVVPLLAFGNITYIFTKMKLRPAISRVVRVLSVAIKDPFRGRRAGAVLHAILESVHVSTMRL